MSKFVPSRIKELSLTGLLVLVAALLQSCASPSGGYGYGDGPPPRDVDVSNLTDAVPKVEPITRAGNPNPYTELGKTYHLLPLGAAYKEQGIASWYGNKFHGNTTSNGEIYNMYAMSAAHKTLRIPAYVKVTNLENGRTVIVRVNDRGPFHGDRIIDLSYAAAKKLGYSDKGTARVEVEAIDPKTFNQYQDNLVVQPQMVQPEITQPKRGQPQVDQQALLSVKAVQDERRNTRLDNYRFDLPANTFLQAGAFSSEHSAKELQQRLQKVTETPIVLRQNQQPEPVYKVLLGPVQDSLELLALRKLLIKTGNIQSFVVYD